MQGTTDNNGKPRCLQFWYHMYGAHVNTLSVHIKPANRQIQPAIWQKSGSQGDKWRYAQIQLNVTGTYKVNNLTTFARGKVAKTIFMQSLFNSHQFSLIVCSRVTKTRKLRKIYCNVLLIISYQCQLSLSTLINSYARQSELKEHTNSGLSTLFNSYVTLVLV